ncbi:MAG: hypothetical protein OES21_03810, partial [Myxococcales bacterium]|nr:hypothetical protein [Myxococcales bacterium]
LIELGDRQIDFFGANVGLLFSTKETRPDAEPSEAANDKPPVAFAIGIRYSHGRGDTLGALLPATYQPTTTPCPPGTSGTSPVCTRPVATKINDIDFNFGVKVLF